MRLIIKYPSRNSCSDRKRRTTVTFICVPTMKTSALQTDNGVVRLPRRMARELKLCSNIKATPANILAVDKALRVLAMTDQVKVNIKKKSIEVTLANTVQQRQEETEPQRRVLQVEDPSFWDAMDLVVDLVEQTKDKDPNPSIKCEKGDGQHALQSGAATAVERHHDQRARETERFVGTSSPAESTTKHTPSPKASSCMDKEKRPACRYPEARSRAFDAYRRFIVPRINEGTGAATYYMWSLREKIRFFMRQKSMEDKCFFVRSPIGDEPLIQGGLPSDADFSYLCQEYWGDQDPDISTCLRFDNPENELLIELLKEETQYWQNKGVHFGEKLAKKAAKVERQRRLRPRTNIGFAPGPPGIPHPCSPKTSWWKHQVVSADDLNPDVVNELERVWTFPRTDVDSGRKRKAIEEDLEGREWFSAPIRKCRRKAKRSRKRLDDASNEVVEIPTRPSSPGPVPEFDDFAAAKSQQLNDSLLHFDCSQGSGPEEQPMDVDGPTAPSTVQEELARASADLSFSESELNSNKDGELDELDEKGFAQFIEDEPMDIDSEDSMSSEGTMEDVYADESSMPSY